MVANISEIVQLEALKATVSARWPALSDAIPAFVSDLVGEIPAGTAPDVYLDGIDLPDLFLARACARGDARAMTFFEASYFPEVAHVLSDMNVAPDLVEEIQQILRERFFVGKTGQRPALASYAGRGSLLGWVRISALREAYRIAAEQKRWEPLEGDDLMQLPALGQDPELRCIKERCRHEFKAAFDEAVAGLTPRQRNLLRHYYLDGMSVGEIGVLYQVHRVSASRWLAEAREAVLSGTRRSLCRRIDVRDQDFDSILQIVDSQLEISMRVLLKLTDP